MAIEFCVVEIVDNEGDLCYEITKIRALPLARCPDSYVLSKLAAGLDDDGYLTIPVIGGVYAEGDIIYPDEYELVVAILRKAGEALYQHNKMVKRKQSKHNKRIKVEI